jgi:hypothetical protein
LRIIIKKNYFSFLRCKIRLDFFGRLPFPNFHLEDKSSWQSSEKMSKQPQGVSFQSTQKINLFLLPLVPLSPGGERGLWHGCKNGKKAKRLWGFFAVLACGVGYFT